jgi:hypothetical protein
MTREAAGGWAWLTDTSLFVSSYAPAFAALALRFECPHWLREVCIGLTAGGLLATLYFLVVMRFLTKDWIVVDTIEDRGADVGGYLATYLLPLVVVSAPTVPDMIAYLLVFASVGMIFVRSRLIYINPTFYLFWYRLFFVKTDDGFAGYLLTRNEPLSQDRVQVVQRGRLLLAVGVPIDDE